MAKVAFELRADHADFSGGTTSLPNGEAYDVGEALKDGKIVLDPDPRGDKPSDDEIARANKQREIVEALDRYPALKRVSASAASDSTSKGASK